jgi:hypothetical protein
VVQNEDLEFIVTLQNPFVFDIEVQSLALRSVGFSMRLTTVLINP